MSKTAAATPPATATADAPQQAMPPADDRYAKHAHLRANVRKRRRGYLLFILLAVAVLAFSIVDILLLDSAAMIFVFVAYAVLLVLGIILLFSRRREVEALPAAEPVAQAQRELQLSLLQCPDCKAVFEYGQVSFHDHRKTAFSCPVCGVYSELPDPEQEPVKVLRPEGDYKQVQYRCSRCGEDLAVGTFGDTPLHLVRFRACPHCGQKGGIVRTSVMPPTPMATDEPDAGTAGV